MKVVDIEQAQMVVVQDGVEIPVTSETAWVRLLNGELVEANLSQEIFTRPQDQRTSDYVTGRFG